MTRHISICVDLFQPFSSASQRSEAESEMVKIDNSKNKTFKVEISNCSRGFPGGSDCKEAACNAGDPGLIPGSERFPGGGNGYPLQYSWGFPGLLTFSFTHIYVYLNNFINLKCQLSGTGFYGL